MYVCLHSVYSLDSYSKSLPSFYSSSVTSDTVMLHLNPLYIIPTLSQWYWLFHKCGLDLDSSQSVGSNLLLQYIISLPC